MANKRRRRGNRWLEDYVPYQIYRITNRLNQRLRTRLHRQPISVSRWRVLGVLRAGGTLTINEIAEMAVMEQPTVSRTVDRLVRDGLVSRQAAKRDSRYVEVSLTEAGKKAFKAISPIAVEHQTKALRGFSESEVAKLSDFLHRIHENIYVEADDERDPG